MRSRFKLCSDGRTPDAHIYYKLTYEPSANNKSMSFSDIYSSTNKTIPKQGNLKEMFTRFRKSIGCVGSSAEQWWSALDEYIKLRNLINTSSAVVFCLFVVVFFVGFFVCVFCVCVFFCEFFLQNYRHRKYYVTIKNHLIIFSVIFGCVDGIILRGNRLTTSSD